MAVRVAIIVPCRNEERYIGRCLDSLLANDYDQQLMDIVIVDGMSTDRTREVVADYATRYACVRLIDNPSRSKPTALNLGISATNAEVVMRIDAHAWYAPNYIQTLVLALGKYGVENVGGVRETAVGESAWQKAVGVVVSHPFAAGNAFYRVGVRSDAVREVDTVFCGCYRRSVFVRIGGFNPRLIRTQDREFNARLTADGGKILMLPRVRCVYYPRTSLASYASWIFDGAFWVFYARRFTRTRMQSIRNLVPAGFVFWHICAFLAFLIAERTFGLLAAPIALYWCIVVLVSMMSALKHRQPWMLPSLIVLFPVTHYGYGLGSCVGWLLALIQGREITDPPSLQVGSLYRLQARKAG